MNTRRILLELFDAALRAVDGRACVQRFLEQAPSAGRCDVVAVGKAAGAMTRGAYAAWGPAIRAGLVITKDGHADRALDEIPGVRQLESSHPLPDIRSLNCGDALERQVLELPPGVMPLFLVSGGSSSLVEALREGCSLDDLLALNSRGLTQGWDIATLNAERVRLSRIKGGGVARLLGPRRALALFISDVPADDPGVIGSGLLGSYQGRPDNIERHIVANIDIAVAAAADAALARGVTLERRRARFDGEVATVARDFVEALRATPADGIVWGGESTVIVSGRAGRGGRNTHLALSAAQRLSPGEKLTILAAGTDGTDGATDDAGAMVDAGTIERAELGGCDVERALLEFDSATALEAAADLVHTGPTGTNVGDILIGLKARGRH